MVVQLLRLGVGLTTPRRKKKKNLVTKRHKGPRTWTESVDKQPKLRKMDMRFCTWNVRRLYRAGSLMTVANRMSKHGLYLVDVQDVRWDTGSIEPGQEE
jgi:hypothetical protein